MVRVEADASNALRRLTKLEKEMTKETDNAAEEISKDAAERGKRQLLMGRSKSFATGTGYNSIKPRMIADHEHAVVGRGYLKLVDSGTKPHAPDVNQRLKVWASQEGWDLYGPNGIVEHIKEEGTDPHPWIDKAFDPVVKTMPTRVVRYVSRRIDF